MIFPVFTGTVRHSRLILDDKDGFDRLVSRQKNGARLALAVAPTFRPATWEQHKYYRGVVLPMIASEIGVSEERMHELLLFRICGLVSPGEGAGTGLMSVEEMFEFTNAARYWAMDFLGLAIPEPEKAVHMRHHEFISRRSSMAEHRICNPGAGGSSPSGGSKRSERFA